MNRVWYGLVGAGAWLLGEAPVWACSVCFGDPAAPMTRGLYWGVVALLGVVLSVLGFITAFFVFIARRSAQMPDAGAGAESELKA